MTDDDETKDDNKNNDDDGVETIECDVLFLACGCKKALSFLTDATDEESAIFGVIEPHTLCTTLFEYDINPQLITHKTAVDIWPNIVWKGNGQIYAYRNSAKCLLGHSKYDKLIGQGKLLRDRGVTYQFLNHPPNEEQDGPILLKQLMNDLEIWGESNIKIIQQEVWDYHPMWNVNDIVKNKYPWKVKNELQ
eukprot:214580_1